MLVEVVDKLDGYDLFGVHALCFSDLSERASAVEIEQFVMLVGKFFPDNLKVVISYELVVDFLELDCFVE